MFMTFGALLARRHTSEVRMMAAMASNATAQEMKMATVDSARPGADGSGGSQPRLRYSITSG